MPGRQPRDGAAAALGVQVGLVQVGAQQCQQRAVTPGKIRARPAVEDRPHGPPRPGGPAGPLGQGQNELMLPSQQPEKSQYMPALCHCLAE